MQALTFDDELAIRQRDRGTTKARGAAWYWGWLAEMVLKEWGPGTEFTADHLVSSIGLPASDDAPSNNAVGGVILALSRRGLIDPVGYTTSSRTTNRHRVLRLWRVL